MKPTWERKPVNKRLICEVGMEKFWENLIIEIEYTGELKPMSRRRIWKRLENK